MSPTLTGSLYVHAPFCARRCGYCDFAVEVRREGGAVEWMEAIRWELARVEAEGVFALGEPLDTLYVGGGTPSLLGETAMQELAVALGASRVGDGTEWTAEANPESLSPEVAAAWVAAGVNRVSIGAQSFDPDALRWMGRLHGPDGIARAVDTARAAGLTNLSIDLIFGLPAHLDRAWRDDLDRALALDVPHLSLYGLTVEAGTPLGRAVAEGREPVVDEERYSEEFLLAAEVIGAAGYVQYEVSNFAREGFQSRHNAAYWDGSPYLGLGNAAHSYAHPLRRWNQRDWHVYREALAQGGLPVAETERLTDEESRLERLWLGLRTAEGIPRSELGAAADATAVEWRARGWARLSPDRLTLTPEGWLLLDRLAVELVASDAG